MAAVLCKAIGDLCILPCKLCAGCCKLCSEMCKPCAVVCANFCKNPFCSFVTVTLLTQVPAAFLFIPEIGTITSCQLSLWLLINSALAIVNIFTAFYLAYRVMNTEDSRMAHLDTAYKRVSYLLCNDCWMAIYICVFIGFIIVQTLGTAWSFKDFFADENGETGCSDTVSSYVSIGTSCGWFFITVGSAALFFSMCCAKFDPQQNYFGNNSNPDVENQHHTQPPPRPNSNSTYTPQGVPTNDFPQQQPHQQQTPPPMYTADGIPTNDFGNDPKYNSQGIPSNDFPPQEEIPFAQAQPTSPSAPPSSYDYPSNAGSAPASSSSAQQQSASGSTKTGGKAGSVAGKQIGKIFTSDKAKQEKLEQQGRKAGEAVEAGFSAASKFVKSKLKKEDKKS